MFFKSYTQPFRMRKIFTITGKKIAQIIDFFYPPFKKFVSPQIFRYAASGSLTLVISWFTFFILYQFVIQKQNINLFLITLSGYTATLVVNFIITLFVGFMLQKYVTFTASELKGRRQLIRYVQVSLLNLLINYVGIKFLWEILHIFPSIANVLVSLFVTVVSYLLQTKYTFPIDKNAKK